MARRAVDRLPEVPRLMLCKTEAAAALGMSLETFNVRVLADLRVVRMGSKTLVPITELEAWIEKNAAMTLANGA